MTAIVKGLAIAALAAGVTACNSESLPVSPAATEAVDGSSASSQGRGVPAKPGDLTILQIVLQDDGEFDILQAAVIKAGLVDALSGNAQYTVFAPTDQAFVSTLGFASEAAAIAAIESMTAEQVDWLTGVLLYHVTEGRRTSTSILGAPAYRMLNGETLTRQTLSQAGILSTDISASNGIVHVIGAVLIP